MLASSGIAFADFDAECTLSGSGAHDFGGNNLLDQLRLTEALQSTRCENDCVVLALFELAQARVDAAAQRMDVEIRADGFELSLTAKAGCAYTPTVGRFLKAGGGAREEA